MGTVHSFQGNERDVIIASMGIGPNDGAGLWRFVEDPHLFTVFMTRARRQMTVLLSADPPAGGLCAAYLAQADSPPGCPNSATAVSPWTGSIASDLTSAGVSVVAGYPSGRHRIDICVQDKTRSLGIECEMDPAGPEAHIEKHLALSRRGWEFLEAYPSRWASRRGELVVALIDAVRRNEH